MVAYSGIAYVTFYVSWYSAVSLLKYVDVPCHRESDGTY